MYINIKKISKKSTHIVLYQISRDFDELWEAVDDGQTEHYGKLLLGSSHSTEFCRFEGLADGNVTVPAYEHHQPDGSSLEDVGDRYEVYLDIVFLYGTRVVTEQGADRVGREDHNQKATVNNGQCLE